MPAGTRNLPDFENPPVAEVVLGTQFDLDHPLSTPHVGMYFQRIRSDFPEVEEHPPLPPQRETFNEEAREGREPRVPLVFGLPPLRRCWFKDRSQNRLIQLQGDRFLHNWRKMTDQEEYPRYEAIKDEFFKRWDEFVGFLQESGLGQPRVIQCEITYVNHLVRGECWETVKDALSLFKMLRAGEHSFLPEAEVVFTHTQFLMGEKAGRLHIDLKPAIRSRDSKELFQLTLTARGAPSDETPNALESWFALGREWIVRGFVDITTDNAHRIWGRKA